MTDRAYQLQVEPYQRPFRRPLTTRYGTWAVREGAIITLRSTNGAMRQGEIAPLEWFGSESLATALTFCQQFNGRITAAQIAQIPDRYPCCQFAFEMALAGFTPERYSDAPNRDRGLATQRYHIAALLPTGPTAINHWRELYAQGYRSFKWKIGVTDMIDEQIWCQRLYQQLPQDCQLRLDANASLSVRDSEQWLTYLADKSIEYLEQPLHSDCFDAMQILAEKYATPIALDESIANLQQINTCYERGWQGLYVIKPAIVGSPQRLTEFVQQHQIDTVFSSVFETEIGYAAALNLAQSLRTNDRALGFGTNEWWDNQRVSKDL
ncbi:o-succinylbenzoate synthase [filamentous cyanobacterium LEGE 11480]|uniref:o-succinylbenzoate synthase n=1 Tax=Romeriopsis navalis LEGE 11480 TaxID=2777977 RepID=A0A928Z2C0_9CYAN|nr:o-succinylbenzoate synthase [Romeriopsis navalis]MBE9028877.1 o-succinylbenzoate synthase [Romeriopsis navalis LEGE 11480]